MSSLRHTPVAAEITTRAHRPFHCVRSHLGNVVWFVLFLLLSELARGLHLRNIITF